jgi:YVTN family beta-propeller protein
VTKRHRRRRGRLLALAGLLVFIGIAVAAGWSALTSRSTPAHDAAASAPRTRSGEAAARAKPGPQRLVERTHGSLQAAVQDAAVAALPGDRVMLLAGLSAADSSRTDIRIASLSRDRAAGQLPAALHDTAAARLGNAVYLFGGGTGSNTQSDQIVRVPLAGGAGTIVAHLPAPSSDQSAAVIAATAYIVGGYTGSRWLDTIVAWQPGHPARVVAHLPFTLRYAAVTAVDGRLVIAGGSLENGSASSAVLAYTPDRGVTRLGRLPAPTTHAAAATLNGIAYVIGGRGSGLDTPTDRIIAITPAGRISTVGRLRTPRSDLAAASLGNGILLAGGRGPAGTVATLSELLPTSVRRTAAAVLAAPAFRSPVNVYAHDGANMLTGAARQAKPLVYVPNSESNTVDVIDPHSYKVVARFAVGGLPQHVVPAWNLKTLYVTNDTGNSLTPINPRTGKPGPSIPVDDPYNMYFTPNGHAAIVVAERLHRLDFRNPHSFHLHRSLSVPCSGVDHIDFSADGRYLLASCEFSGQMVVVDVNRERVVRTIDLPDGSAGMPQDVKLSPDGRTFYVADMHANGLWEINARSWRVERFLATGAGAHGLYPSRDAKLLYVSNRSAGTISVLSFRTRKIVATWRIPGGSPDMGGVSADGNTLWLSGRYNAEVYAISTKNGQLLARIPVGAGPHGLCVWPQPGRYSLGHTGILR